MGAGAAAVVLERTEAGVSGKSGCTGVVFDEIGDIGRDDPAVNRVLRCVVGNEGVPEIQGSGIEKASAVCGRGVGGQGTVIHDKSRAVGDAAAIAECSVAADGAVFDDKRAGVINAPADATLGDVIADSDPDQG